MIKSKTLNQHEKNDVLFLTFPKLDAVGGNKHGFSTRIGGVSKGQFSQMSFGFFLGDNKADVTENYRRFCNALGVDCNNVVLSKQTHTANLRVVTEEDIGKGLFKDCDYADVDGLITNESGIVLVTQYADCTPLVFFDPVKRVVATSHAGWRGTVKEIAAHTIELMQGRFGCDTSNIICGIGPCIGKCCYEVDEPVINEINKLTYLKLDMCYSAKGNGKYMLDLKEVNRQVLISRGIKPENIDVADLCTCCHPDVFHSHRATSGKRGTLAMMIALD